VSLYLYAIVGSRPRQALGRGIAGAPLASIRASGTTVVIERAPAPAVTAETIRAHDRVVRRIARACAAVLPFRFGSVVADRAALASLLEPIAASASRALDLVRDCVQFTLRVYGTAEPSPPPRRGEGPGTRWMNARLRARRVPEIAEVTAKIAPFVRGTRVERHDRAPLLASVYHLVARDDVRRYRAALSAGSRLLEGVRVESSGPWPPYAFAEIP
jgi:hypothetical protein